MFRAVAMITDDFFKQLDEYGCKGIPCLFIIDFEEKQPVVFPLQNIDPAELLYSFPGTTNCPQAGRKMKPSLLFSPVSYDAYRKAFREVQDELVRGNSYLLNLTFSTPVESSSDLADFFHAGGAAYRLCLRDQFVFFSPEQFVCIRDNMIRTFPMKGTCDAGSPDAGARLLADEKETAEHVTVVDLLRNDLSKVARNVRVQRFRFLTKVNTTGKQLLQASSEICGELAPGWQSSLGNIMRKL
ncbi:MAG: aminodeoxychorismate synthase component I, partial [Spirochaetaceae bacterium]